jgi:hypothetical protein
VGWCSFTIIKKFSKGNGEMEWGPLNTFTMSKWRRLRIERHLKKPQGRK